MNWLALDKNVWRQIFQILSTQSYPNDHYDICTLRVVCQFMRNVSLIRMNGIRWIFYRSGYVPNLTFVRTPAPKPPIWDWELYNTD